LFNVNSVNMPELATGQKSNPVSYADALENYRKNTDWWIVLEAFDLNNFNGSALWVSQRTGLDVETVIEALEGLSVLGLLTKSSNGFEKIQKDFLGFESTKNKQQRFLDHSLVSSQILNHLNEDSKAAIRYGHFASNLSIITEMYEKINQVILEADEKSKALSRDQIDNVYLLSMTAVTAIPTQSAGGNHA
jgi:hypothetical protein